MREGGGLGFVVPATTKQYRIWLVIKDADFYLIHLSSGDCILSYSINIVCKF